MTHFSCDSCGKDIEPNSRFVAKIEVFPALVPDPEGDADIDPLDAMDDLLGSLSDEELENPTPESSEARFDLCGACRAKFLRDPLSRERAVPKWTFSRN